MKKPIVVNLFAGPGSGKSSLCADIFAGLKWNGVNCEMALEFAKSKVWEGSVDVLHDQIYVFGKQQHELFSLRNKVDVIITDSPLLLSLIYYKGNSSHFKNLVVEEFNRYNNLNIFIKRIKKYNPKGRLQTEKEARLIDSKILSLLSELKLPYDVVIGGSDTRDKIVKDIMKKL